MEYNIDDNLRCGTRIPFRASGGEDTGFGFNGYYCKHSRPALYRKRASSKCLRHITEINYTFKPLNYNIVERLALALDLKIFPSHQKISANNERWQNNNRIIKFI